LDDVEMRAAERGHGERLATLQQRIQAWLVEPPGPDVERPNALAADLAGLADDLHAELAEQWTSDPASLVVAGESLALVVGLQDQLRTQVMSHRFHVLEQIHESLMRLRGIRSTSLLVGSAAAELAASCGVDRVVLAGVRGSSWRAEAVHVRRSSGDAEVMLRGHQGEDWTHLTGGALETELLRRRTPILVRADDRRPRDRVFDAPGFAEFVAAPVIANQRVVGFFYADCASSGRRLTTVDRDNVACFAEAFGLIFERSALLERLERQRIRVHDVVGRTERDLAGFDAAETVLVRRDRESIAVVRMAAGLRKIAISALDQLLTIRERQVLDLMVEGARNRQIAEQLVISEETVKSHVRSISRKLHASSRADAVSRYLHLRLREQA
jgi:DNA-binding CsgD family transcriptional regulator